MGPRMSTLVGSRLDKYEIQSEVGHGGMAVVYRGIDTVLSREVAVKVLHPHMAGREESRARLRREALTVAKLRHENILEIYDYSGENAAESYLVTEFIHGMTLREWLDTRWRPRPALAALVVHRLCVALGHAHKFGIVHRDIKPENVMIRSDGCLKLMDFGIAQMVDHQKLTMTGQLLGSPAYMAPELISGKPIDARTDLFAVGVMLYQLSTGELPFSGRNPHEVLARIADAEFTRPGAICSLVDDELEAVIERALAREPERRYQSAEDLARELERYLGEVGVAASQEEVTAYFTDPERYVDQLDKRVCTALMTRAEASTRAGHSARAIRLLGRVLELERDQKQAKQMLSRLRTRERTIRRIALGGAVLVGTAGVSGGVVFLSMMPPPAEELGALDEAPTPSAPRPVIPREPEKRPPAVSDPGPPADQPTPPSTPRDPPGDPPGVRKTLPRPGDPTKTNPRPVPSGAVTCRVRVEGIPVPMLPDYTLGIGGQEVQLKGDLGEFPITGERVTIRLLGQRYGGYKDVSRETCAAGTVVVLAATPRPAQIEFINYPPDTTVRCVSGPCPIVTPHLLASAKYPPVRLGDQVEARLTFEVKAPGHVTKQMSFSVHPGVNKPEPINLAENPR